MRLQGFFAVLLMAVLAGCSSGGTGSTVFTPTSSDSSSTSTASVTPMLNGVVASGTLPLKGAAVVLYSASDNGTTAIASAVSDGSGAFTLAPSATTTSGLFYATASLGSGVQLMNVIGTSLPSSITINELTTVAAGYATAQFQESGTVRGSSFGLRSAAGMNANLVNPVTGASSTVLLSPPNADQTNSLRSTRALANLLAYYVRNQGAGISTFFAQTTPPGGTAPATLPQALANLARNPQLSVAAIYAETKFVEPYTPALTQQPDVWTIAVKVNQTGSATQLFGGPANIVFDANGYAWVNNNVFQGGPKSVNFNIILKPNGMPADGLNGTPKSPLMGGGIYGPGFGLDIDPRGSVWVGNFGWGNDNPTPTGNGSVSQFTSSGVPVSPANGYQGGAERVQGVTADAQGNIWLASYGNDRLVVFQNGDPTQSVFFQQASGALPFGVVIARDGSCWLTNSGGLDPGAVSSVGRYVLSNGKLQQQFLSVLGHSLKGFALDSQGNAWLASGGDNTVYLVDPAGHILGQFQGGGVNSPWSTTVDGDDNVWVANFGPMVPGANYTNSGISKLAGPNAATRPPGTKMGDPISPPTGYTLPSAGSEVLLSDGTPLYPHGPKCFSPLMRVTSVNIDQAGNLWAVNNWKPDFDIDLAHNPGGDGICIFVGLAKPPARKR